MLKSHAGDAQASRERCMDNDRDTEEAEINARLQSFIDEADEPPAWAERWQKLTEKSTVEERLAVYREIRSSRILPEAAATYLITSLLDGMARRKGSDALQRIEEKLTSIAEKAGRSPDDLWEPGDGPPEFQRLQKKYYETRATQFLAALDEYGESKLAALFRNDLEQFEQLTDEGRSFFHGETSDGEEPALPEWIDEMVDAVAAHLAAETDLGPLGIRFRKLDSGRWEVVVHPTPVEVVGGASDGAIVSPAFSVDIESLRAEFDRVDGCGLCSHGMFTDESAFLWIDGVYSNRELTLRILIEAPDNEAPGSRMDVNRREP